MKKRIWVGLLVVAALAGAVAQMALTLRPLRDIYTSGVEALSAPFSSAGPATEASPVPQQGSCFVGTDTGEVRLSTDGNGTYWCVYPPENVGAEQHISARLNLLTASTCAIIQFRRVDGSGYALALCQSKVTILDLTRREPAGYQPIDSLEVGRDHEVTLTQTDGRVTFELDGELILNAATAVTSSGDGAVELGVTRSSAGAVSAAFTEVTINPED